MTEITDLNPVDESNTSLTGNGITGGNFVSNFDNAMRGLLGLLGRLNSGASPISDAFTLADPADLTKRVRIDAGNVTAGQTRVFSMPDANLSFSANGASLVSAANYAAMRALLDLEAGTDFNAYSANLAEWSGIDPSANGASLVSAANYAAMRALLDLEAGTDFYSISAANAAFQPLDADLTALAAAGNSSVLAATTASFLTADETKLDASREVLTANRTYYVRTDGSDSNNGLANTSGGAFLTIQKAINVAWILDLGGFSITIQVADGTYTGSISVDKPFIGGNVFLIGNTTTPANCIISHSAYGAFSISGGGVALSVGGFKVQNSAASSLGQGILISNGAQVTISGNMDFGACTRYHLEINRLGDLAIGAGYTISGDASHHWYVDGGTMTLSTQTITMSGSRAFSGAFAACTNRGGMTVFVLTKSGSATGKYYDVTLNGVINTFGAGATALFGNAAGTTATGGQYA